MEELAMTIAIKHKKMDREEEEKEEGHLEDPNPPFFWCYFSLTFPSGSQITHLVSERLSWVYNLRPINR